MDDIEPITPLTIPSFVDYKMFFAYDEEGNTIGEPFSYNDWVKIVKSCSGVNQKLLGTSDGEL